MLSDTLYNTISFRILLTCINCYKSPYFYDDDQLNWIVTHTVLIFSQLDKNETSRCKHKKTLAQVTAHKRNEISRNVVVLQ